MHVTPDCSCWGSRVVSGIKLSFEFNPLSSSVVCRLDRSQHWRRGWNKTPRSQRDEKFARNLDDDERTFDCHGDKNTLGLRWKRWLTVFERFADGKGLILNEDNANNRQETCVNALSCGSRSSRYFPYRTQEIWRITGKRSLHWTHTSLSKSTLSMLDIVSDS